MPYQRPITIAEWKIDEPKSESHLAAILEDRTVLPACGRYAQNSGSGSVSRDAVLAGEMNDLVGETMGREVLGELLAKLRCLSGTD